MKIWTQVVWLESTHFWLRYLRNICKLDEWLPFCLPERLIRLIRDLNGPLCARQGPKFSLHIVSLNLHIQLALPDTFPKSDASNHISLSLPGLSAPPSRGGAFWIWNHGLSSFRKKYQTKDSGGGISPEKHVAELSRFRRHSPSVQKLNPREMKLWISCLCSPFSLRDKGKINS